ncbi:PLC-like phosphodiesterase [Zopfochytrium polystomum]|nr:PLC-like phosphodiesterase [Zopfochytrium polystomum]
MPPPPPPPLLLLPLLLLLASVSTVNAAAVGACNGQVAYCSRSYSNVTQVVSHDAPFVGPDVWDNQNVTVAAQLALGVRFLQLQTHNDSKSVLSVCHSSCDLVNAGSLASFLASIKAWLTAAGNEREVLTLLIANGDFSAPGLFAAAFVAAGLDAYAFRPGSAKLALAAWPTFQALIDSGKRLVVFMDYKADLAVVPYLIPEFTYFFETPYDVTSTTALAGCAIDRPAGGSAAGAMYLINHFLDYEVVPGLDIPDVANAPTTNSAASIMAQVQKCLSLGYGRYPKGILLDWIDVGEAFAVERALNGV